MNIEEIKKKKAKLQCNIQKLLSDFEKETGTRITDVNYFIEDNNGFVFSKGFEITVEIWKYIVSAVPLLETVMS